MGQYDLLIESLKSSKASFNPDGLVQIWEGLISGEIASEILSEKSREELVNRLVVNVKAVDGNDYEITISRARKWV